MKSARMRWMRTQAQVPVVLSPLRPQPIAIQPFLCKDPRPLSPKKDGSGAVDTRAELAKADGRPLDEGDVCTTLPRSTVLEHRANAGAAGARAEAPRGQRVWRLRSVRAGHRRGVERHTPSHLLLATSWLGHSAQDLRCARARERCPGCNPAAQAGPVRVRALTRPSSGASPLIGR